MNLDELYQAILDHTTDDKLNLIPGVFSTDKIGNFYGKFAGVDNEVIITGVKTTPPTDGKVIVAGATLLLGIQRADVNFVFTEDGEVLVSNALYMMTDAALGLPGVPWFSIGKPKMGFCVADDELAITGHGGGTLKLGSREIEINMPFPATDQQWLITADFAVDPPGISDLFQIVGGSNLLAALPPPINAFGDLKLKQFTILFDSARTKVGSMGLLLEAVGSWHVFGKVNLKKFSILCTMLTPGDLASRGIVSTIGSTLEIGSGRMDIAITYPNLSVNGALAQDSPQPLLSDFITMFAEDLQVPINGNISQLAFFVSPGLPVVYSVRCAVQVDWPITVNGKTIFTITGLSFFVQGVSTSVTGNFTGSTIILPDSANIHLSVSASYDGPEVGWTFEGRTTEPISVAKLLESAPFHFDPGSQAGYNIDSLSLVVATGDNSWTFDGELSDWRIDFLDLTIKKATIKAGQKGKERAIFHHPALRSSNAALLVADEGLTTFAEIEVDIVWLGIEINTWLKFSAGDPSWGFTWKQLTGTVKKENNEWIGKLTFDDNITLGSMIEDMVSWITGSRFGLESPWNFLNSINLSNLSLTYNFTKKTVEFGIDIGPIDLGFARIDSIQVGYGPNPKDKNKRGVMVSLKGSFPWNVGDAANGNSSSLGPWDASQPGTAPAPPGNGNKYLDLRMLAMGQHVHVTGLEKAKTVQEAIELMKNDLPDPPDPSKPTIPPVTFDPQSAWLFGTDFGVLRFGDEKSGNNGSNGAPLVRSGVSTLAKDRRLLEAAGASGYLLTLQTVFNDPTFYALRVKLDGESAKIFKGLDFQILYRQVSETVGVYQTEITLPDVMRHLSIGVYSITLPVFGIAVYTNGDFQVDVGFPWNSNFTRSFTIEGIIYPGIPVIGSAGFYFGKLSSASTNRVPQTTLGTFNPVIVFGFGLQVGFGKSIEYGVLKAGFSLTVFGILEGVIAKWNPFQLTDGGSGSNSQIQGAYYFWLQGTVGIIGKLYGSVDFAIIKASVNVELKLLVQLTYESYVSISVTVLASVDVSASLEINLGLFSISVHFSFSMRLKETFTMLNSGQAPWQLGAGASGALQGPANLRLSAVQQASARVPLLAAAAGLKWSNLKKPDAGPAPLYGYMAPALTVARDEWATNADPSTQVPCHVVGIFMESTAPTNQDDHSSRLKALGEVDDTSFEKLCKMVLRWAVAALQSSPMSADEVDRVLITRGELELLNEALVSSSSSPTPVPESEIDSFLTNQFRVSVQVPPPVKTKQTKNATYFPMAPPVKLAVPSYGNDYSGCTYAFNAYNTITAEGLKQLRQYFDDLAVQVQQEMQNQPPLMKAAVQSFSMSDWIYTDYFLLLARQMVQAASEALRDFKYPIATGQTGNAVVSWINTTGQLADGSVYTLGDLFAANRTHMLNTSSKLTIGVTYAVNSESFHGIASHLLQGRIGGLELAHINASRTDILQPEQIIQYPGKSPYVVKLGNSLDGIAQTLGVQLRDLVLNTTVLVQPGLLLPEITLSLPQGESIAANQETFTVIAEQLYGGAFTASELALANAANSQLLQAGAVITIGKKSHIAQAGDTLIKIARVFECQVSELVINASLLTQPKLLASHATIFIPLVRYQTQSGNTFESIAKQAMYAGAFTSTDLALQNAGLDILRTGAQVLYPLAPMEQRSYEIQPRDCLGDVANYFGVSVAELLKSSLILTQADLLAGVAVLFTPPFTCQTQQADQLVTVASRFATTVDVIAAQPANGQVADLFAVTDAMQKPDPYLDVPHLAQFRVAELIAECQRSLALQHLSSMASRYYLHGLRLPTEHIKALQAGMWTKKSGNDFILPAYAGLYALTGQQFPLPVIKDKDFVITFDNAAGPTWLEFTDDQKKTNLLKMVIAPGSDDAKRINAVITYARKNRLDIGMRQLGSGAIAQSELESYPFTSSFIWQSAARVELPYSPSQGSVPALKLWRIPNAMLGLFGPAESGDPAMARAVNPRFKLQIARYDEATGSTQTSDARNYGWASVVEFTIKRIPEVASSPASAMTYEIVGAGGKDIVLLEQIIAQVGNNKEFFDQLLIGYAPVQTGNATYGIQTDPPAGVTMGIAQVDLSTETRPFSAVANRALRAGMQGEMLNSAPEFITLLWEASIVRSGGFYLYYYNHTDGTGLPDRIFNDRNEATVNLIVLYAKPSSISQQNTAASFMNAVATGDSIDSNHSTLFAQADPPPTAISSTANASLATIAYAYYSDIGDLAADNSSLPLAAGTRISVDQGIFQSPPEGMSLDTIAKRFSTKITPLTVADLRKANPQPLADPLLFPAAIKLPQVIVTAGTDAGRGSLGEIAAYYGENLTALAATNQNVQGLFAATEKQPVHISGGPRTRHASVPAGVLSAEAVRSVPPTVPEKVDDPDYAKNFLLNLYTLLNYQIAGNAYFTLSKLGLPAGPTAKPSQSMDKIRRAPSLGADDFWYYKQSFPYPKFVKTSFSGLAGLPPSEENPYRALGRLLQVDYTWQDNYGNTLVTTLSDPKSGDAGPLNQAPMLTGYTDLLINVNQWPAVSSDWQLVPQKGTGPELQLRLSFDASKYQGMLKASALASGTQVLAKFTEAVDQASASDINNYSLDNAATISLATPSGDGLTVTLTTSQLADARYTLTIKNIKTKELRTSFSGEASFDFPDNPETYSSAVQQKALQDLHVYTQLYFQLTDPNGVACSIESSLFETGENPQGMLPFTDEQFKALEKWLFQGDGKDTSIYAFLQGRSVFQDAGAPQAQYVVINSISPKQVNPQQVFELSLAITIARTASLVAGDLQTTSGVRKSSARVAPRTEKVLQPGGDTASSTVGITRFAQDFQDALSVENDYRLKIATGIDRFGSRSSSDGNTLWAVRVGWTGRPIGYTVTDGTKNDPQIFAPQPVSNHLRSEKVEIRDYTTGKGISPTPTRSINFVDIDVNVWVQQFFGDIDNLLTPQFTAPMQIVGEKKGKNYLGKVLQQKKSLANIAKHLMISAFSNQSADAAAAQEVFYQQMLTRLSNAYTVRAAMQFKADVKTDIPHTPEYPPQLYGNIIVNKLATKALGDPADGGETGESCISFTAPRLALKTNPEQPFVFLLSAPDTVRSETGAVVKAIQLNLDYNGTSIEHQIGTVPGIQDYHASTWLSFVIRDEEWPLQQPLGEFPVPMFLRAFPASPSMTAQEGDPTYPDTADVSLVRRWNYLFSYSLPFHYPQDVVYCEVEFNLRRLVQADADLRDAFPQLAEFVTVVPAVNKDLQEVLAAIDAAKQDRLEDAAVALDSFCTMVEEIITAAGEDDSVREDGTATDRENPSRPGLAMRKRSKALSGAPDLTYKFQIKEDSVSIDSQQALRVSLIGAPPAGVGTPRILIDPDHYECKPYTEPGGDCDKPGNFYFVYINKDGRYLPPEEGQRIPERQVFLRDMDILQRQDALSTVYLKRNDDLIDGKTTAEPFIYQTANVQFANTLYPVIDSALSISIAEEGVKLSLQETLQALFSRIFVNTVTQSAVIQVEVSYGYSINASVQSVTLPLLMQPSLAVSLPGPKKADVVMDQVTLEQMIADWTKAIELWFTENLPDASEGVLWFDLAIMSDLTEKPMPLLRLRRLYLPIGEIQPPLPTEPVLAAKA